MLVNRNLNLNFKVRKSFFMSKQIARSKSISMLRLDNSKKKREVVTKEAVSAHKEKQTELEQTELPDQDPTDKKDPSKKNSDRTE